MENEMTSPTTDRRLGLNGNVAIKAPVACATTAAITLSGEQVIDGVTTSTSRVLVKDQTPTSANGIYDSSSSTWTRSIDCNGTYDIVVGTTVQVTGGTTHAGEYFSVSGTAPLAIGTSSLAWSAAALPVGSLAAQLADTASAANGAAMIGVKLNATGAVARTQDNKNADVVNVLDLGVVFDNSTNNQAAFANALVVTKSIEMPGGIARVGTGNLALLTGQTLRGQGRELTFLRTTHATYPVISTSVPMGTVRDMTVDRSGSVAGQGVVFAGASNLVPVESALLRNVDCNGNASGAKFTDFVYASVEDCYLQSGTTGLECTITGSNFATMLSVNRSWLRSNTTTGASLTGVKNSHLNSVAFEGSGVSTATGISISGGGVHTLTSCWWEDVKLGGTFVGCGSVHLNSGYINGASLVAQGFYAVQSGGVTTTVIFDGAWEVQNLSKPFATADIGATIIIRSRALLGLTFSAVNGGTVVFDCPLEGNATYNPGSIASLVQDTATTVTVTGAAIGDVCYATFDNGTSDPASFNITAICLAPDTVTVRFFNLHSAPIDMASGTISVRVQKRALIS
jgi:hypothetical protein